MYNMYYSTSSGADFDYKFYPVKDILIPYLPYPRLFSKPWLML